MNAAQAGLYVDQLTVTWRNGHTALRDASFSVPRGSIAALVGVNGSGKSTLFKALMGFVRVGHGEIAILGQPVNRALRQNLVAYVPQSEEVDWSFPVLVEDVVMMGRYGHMGWLRRAKPRDREIVDAALARVGMSEYRHRQIGELSGGQKKRVFLARAIAQQGQVILLDEPLSNLDAKLRASMRIRISDLHKQLKKSGKPATTVYVTHDQTEAMTMGDRICVMKLGHIMQVDTPDNLYHQPKNMFVAGFIGAPEMNIRPSQLVEHGGRLHLTLGDQRLPLNDRLQSKVETHKNQQVFFGVRPEFVSLSDEPFAEGSCAGEMVRVENMGHEFFVYLRVADYELTARVPSDDAKPMIAKGLNRKVYFTFDLNKCHIFDAKTEQNLSL